MSVASFTIIEHSQKAVEGSSPKTTAFFMVRAIRSAVKVICAYHLGIPQRGTPLRHILCLN